jgi:penicillin-binding protein 1A
MVGVDKGAQMVKRFGLPNPMKRVLPSALGATEEPLLDMVSAYSAFSNQGVRVKAHLIEQVIDADGTAIQKWEPESYKVISGYVAAQMRDMMRGVVTGGTAGSMMSNKELAKRMICGKTGTVNDFTDAWFIGYTPSYTAGVWIGFPGEKKSLGNKEAGSVAALPMWMYFMEKFLADKPNDQYPKAPPPDREILARRTEAERAIRKAAAEEAAAQANDETADKAKSAAQEDQQENHEQGTRPKPLPKLVEPEKGAPTDIDRPPPRRPKGDEPSEKKRGKNG